VQDRWIAALLSSYLTTGPLPHLREAVSACLGALKLPAALVETLAENAAKTCLLAADFGEVNDHVSLYLHT
jgi:hypothetical protein